MQELHGLRCHPQKACGDSFLALQQAEQLQHMQHKQLQQQQQIEQLLQQ